MCKVKRYYFGINFRMQATNRKTNHTIINKKEGFVIGLKEPNQLTEEKLKEIGVRLQHFS